MSDHPHAPNPPHQPPDPRPPGPARDFAAFCELDRERRRNSDDDFDPSLFDAAMALVLGRLDAKSEPRSEPSAEPRPSGDLP